MLGVWRNQKRGRLVRIEAYNMLKVEQPVALECFENELTPWVHNEEPEQRHTTSKPFRNEIALDEQRRREQMNKIIDLWLLASDEEPSEVEDSDDGSSQDSSDTDKSSGFQRLEDESSRSWHRNASTRTKRLNIINSLRHVMRSTARRVPEAALLWAAVCFSIQVRRPLVIPLITKQ
jgi:hypothetical protein